MNKKWRSASGVAMIAGLAGSLSAWGQQAQTVDVFAGSGPQQSPPPFAAQAPAPPPASAEADRDRVVVTGSLIAGTAEDTAIPVEAFASDELKERGNPSIVQLVKTIPASGSAVGESNRYAGGAGTATINLRGFGAARSLVLMNGQRIADNPQTAGVDLNFIPQAAVGRIEVLKDGAAATYGSDAVGGVINFITRRDLNGFYLEAEYALVDGTDGEYLANAAYGKQFDNGNILITAGYRHRSRLDIHDRDWAIGGFADTGGYNGAGGWTGAANPGIYNPNGATAATRAPTFRDNGCAELGGTLTNTVTLPDPLFGLKPGHTTATVSVPVPVNANSPQSASSVCRYQFSNFNDLVNEEDHYQGYGEANFELSETVKFHAEAAWNRNNVVHQRISPANLSTQFPTPSSLGGFSGSLATPGAQNFFVPYNVPAYAPGLIDLRTNCAAPLTAAQCTAAAAPGGVDISQTSFRAIAFAGHPLNADGADYQEVQQTEWRVSGGMNVKLFDAINWNTNLTYSDNTGTTNSNDLLVDRIQLALNGWGSLDTDPNSCTPAERTVANAGNAAVGCYFFNPFTNSLANANPNIGGASNPYYRGAANPAVINNPHAVAWLYGNYTNTAVNQLFVAESVFTGELPFFKLPGGDIGWAAGGQWRYDRTSTTYGDFNNYQTYPCVDSIDVGVAHPVCQAPAGPIQFFGSNANFDNDRSVSAVFGEMKFPILDTLEADLAIRYEDYGGGIGGNTSPKLSGRWQVFDWFAVRGSISKTFRAPSSNQISTACSTGVANIGGQYRAVRGCGNPALQPEKADGYNIGTIFKIGGFNATVDYFHIDFKGELTTESSSRLFASMFPTATGHCGEAAFAALQARFAFANNACLSTNVLRIDFNNVNGPDTETAGFDFKASYDWDDAFKTGTDVRFGVDATLLSLYKRGAFTLLGAPDIRFSDPENRAGLYDLTSQFFSYPRLRGTLFASATKDTLTARWQVRYVEGTEPAFGTTFFQQVPDTSQPSGYRLVAPGKTDDFWQNDLILTWRAPFDLVVTGSVENIFDTDPPTAFSNYNYDYTSGNPLGRVFKINLRKTF